MSTKRWILVFPLVVAFLLISSFSPCLAIPFPGGGSGTENDPYIIMTAEHLDAMRIFAAPDAYFKLGADIDLDVAPYNTGEGWDPIGGVGSFAGHLDGDYHKILNLFINRPDTDVVGLISQVWGPGSSVRNLFLEDAEVHGKSHAGALAGYTQTVLIENCGMTGSVSAVGMGAGGLVGEAGSATTIRQCFSLGSVEGAVYVGGLVGYFFDGQVLDSFSRADAEATTSDCGGLIGHGNDNAVDTSYAAGRVTAPSGSGGLMGTGEHAPLVTGCYYDEDVSGQADNSYGEPRSTAEMKTSSTFSGWDFDAVWARSSRRNDGYPYLQWAEEFFMLEDESGSSGGCSTGILNPLFLLVLAPLGLLRRKPR